MSELDLDILIKRLDPDPEDLSISVSGLQHFFGEGETRTQILFDIDLQITSGEIVIITGPSGCGKTTLLTLIGTLAPGLRRQHSGFRRRAQWVGYGGCGRDA